MVKLEGKIVVEHLCIYASGWSESIETEVEYTFHLSSLRIYFCCPPIYKKYWQLSSSSAAAGFVHCLDLVLLVHSLSSDLSIKHTCIQKVKWDNFFFYIHKVYLTVVTCLDFLFLGVSFLHYMALQSQVLLSVHSWMLLPFGFQNLGWAPSPPGPFVAKAWPLCL